MKKEPINFEWRAGVAKGLSVWLSELSDTELMLLGSLPKQHPLNEHLNFYYVDGTCLCRDGEPRQQIDCRVTANALAAARNRVLVLEDLIDDLLTFFPEGHEALSAAVLRLGYRPNAEVSHGGDNER